MYYIYIWVWVFLLKVFYLKCRCNFLRFLANLLWTIDNRLLFNRSDNWAVTLKRVAIAKKLKSLFKNIARRCYEKSFVYMCLRLSRLVILCNDIPESFDPPSPRGIYAVFANNWCTEPATNKTTLPWVLFLGAFKKKSAYSIYFSAEFYDILVTHVRESHETLRCEF